MVVRTNIRAFYSDFGSSVDVDRDNCVFGVDGFTVSDPAANMVRPPEHCGADNGTLGRPPSFTH